MSGLKCGVGAALGALALGLAAAHAGAEDGGRLARFYAARNAAETALKAGRMDEAEADMIAALALVPNHPGSLTRLARIQARAGHAAAAEATLMHYAGLGLTWAVTGDQDFKTLPHVDAIAARMALNGRPTGAASALAQVDPPGPLEGLVEDSASGRRFASSIGRRTLFELGRDGRVTPFLKGEARGGLFGMAVDGRRRSLWVAESQAPGIPGTIGASYTGLLEVDLASGLIRRRIAAPVDGETHLIGDVTLGPDGTVYATDSIGGLVYRLAPGAASLEVIVSKGVLASPQGMAVMDRGRALVLSDYTTGLWRLDLASRRLQPVPAPATASLISVDGMVRGRGGLIVTQNGTTPQRVLRLALDAPARRITRVDVLAANLPGMDDVSLGALGPDGYLFVGHSGWSDYGEDGKPARAPSPGLVFRLRR